ncbi:MAG: nucleotidyl transferase AbiEii/AbiGii toxin family protein [Nanoarchaeota archaeon]
MIKKGIIDYLADKLNIEAKEVIEKDLILHSLLYKIETNEYFKDNFVFKGGTCLIKCYLGYYRFSEDLDFTWINQKEFEGKSQKEIRRLLSVKIDKLISIFGDIANKTGLDFKEDKSNKNYIEIGGSNRLATFKLRYKSGVLNTDSFIKIQINFVELFLHPFLKSNVNSIAREIDFKEFGFLFPDDAKIFIKNLVVEAYDIREILIEKVRAILTRRGIKARDFIDVFSIAKEKKLDIKKLRNDILTKTRFMLRYRKYLQNLRDFQLEKFVLGEEEKLVLKPVDKEFPEFIKEFHVFLIELVNELKNKHSSGK